MGAEVIPRATFGDFFKDRGSMVMVSYSESLIPERKSWYDSIKTQGYLPRTNCNSCAAPIRYSQCEYCGCETGLTARIPLSKSEKLKIEAQFLAAVHRQLPKRGFIERVFDRMFLHE